VQQIGRLADWQIGRLADWQIGRLADYWIGRLQIECVADFVVILFKIIFKS
jgi:hypothetical protein